MWGTHGKPGSLSLGRHTGQDTGLSWHLPALDLPLLTEWAHAGPPELPPVCFEFLEQWRVTECPPPHLLLAGGPGPRPLLLPVQLREQPGPLPRPEAGQAAAVVGVTGAAAEGLACVRRARPAGPWGPSQRPVFLPASQLRTRLPLLPLTLCPPVSRLPLLPGRALPLPVCPQHSNQGHSVTMRWVPTWLLITLGGFMREVCTPHPGIGVATGSQRVKGRWATETPTAV